MADYDRSAGGRAGTDRRATDGTMRDADRRAVLGRDVALSAVRGGFDLHPAGGDLGVRHGLDNLVQALTLRLSAERGSFTHLGHPEYGSRLIELIGRTNDTATRDLVKFYTIECIRGEPRVEEILDVIVTTTTDPDRVEVTASVRPIGETDPINLVFPFYLDG